MLPEISQIKDLRNKLGLKQHELAKQAGISQSLIAKLESRKTEASYNKVREIFKVLREIESSKIKKEKTCGEIMNNKIKTINSNEAITKAVEIMKKFSFSQLPVMEKGKSVGVITESNIAFFEGDKSKVKVKEVMEGELPIVNKETSIGEIKPLLERNPAILVSEKGKVIGIVTKIDLI